MAEKSDDKEKQSQTQEPQINSQNNDQQIPIDEQTAYNIKILEFNKDISDAKALAAKLEAERDKFIYESNVNSIVAQHNAQQTEAKNKQQDVAPRREPSKKDEEQPQLNTSK